MPGHNRKCVALILYSLPAIVCISICKILACWIWIYWNLVVILEGFVLPYFQIWYIANMWYVFIKQHLLAMLRWNQGHFPSCVKTCINRYCANQYRLLIPADALPGLVLSIKNNQQQKTKVRHMFTSITANLWYRRSKK